MKVLTKELKQEAALERKKQHAARQAAAATRRAALNEKKSEKQKARETKRINSLRRTSHLRRTSKSSKGKNKEELSPRATRIRWRNEMGNNRPLENISLYIPYTSPSPSPPPAGIRNSHPFNAKSPMSLSANRSTSNRSRSQLTETSYNNQNIDPHNSAVHKGTHKRVLGMNPSNISKGIKNILIKYKSRNLAHELMTNPNSKGLEAILNKTKRIGSINQ